MSLPSSLTTEPENPFPGLRSFELHEDHLFFGREKHIEDVLQKLFTYRFVAVVGSSGSGKSSLIRAGLLPMAYKGLNKFSGADWKVAVFHPGNSPLDSLVKSLTQAVVFGKTSTIENEKLQNEIRSVLNASPLGLIEVVRKLNSSEKPLLILIDQFEELFRFQNLEKYPEEENPESEKFVKLFTEAIQQRDVPIYVMLTIRADFLGDCARFEGLPEAINDGQYLVPQMNREQIKSAIIKPLELAKGKISPRLLHQLLSDIKDRQDQLPILQHSMMRAWDQWRLSTHNGQPIDIEHYQIIGTMSEALSKHADEVYNSLQTEKQKSLAEIIFKTLTIKGSDNRGIRRPTSLRRLCEICETNEKEIIEVLDQFRTRGRTFITPSFPAEIAPGTIVDISHESLMRIWTRCEKWVEEEYQAALLYHRLSESAQLYEEGKSALWRDPELQFALDWNEKINPNKAWSLQYNEKFDLSMRFLNLSVNQRMSERKKEKRRRTLTTSFVTLFFMSCTFLTMWALKEQKSSASSAEEALKQKQIAEMQSDTALQMKTAAEQRAVELAKQTEVAENKTAEADKQKLFAEEQKLLAQQSEKIATLKTLETVQALKTTEQEKQNALLQKKIAEEEKLKADAEKNQKEKLRLLSVAKTMAVKAISKFDDVELPALLALQSYQFNNENGGTDQDPDIYEALRKSLVNLNNSNSHIIQANTEFSALGINESNQSILAASVAGQVISVNIKNLQTHQVVVKDMLARGIINSIFMSSNGRFLLAAYENFNMMLWDLASGSNSGIELRGHSGWVRAVAFDKNNKVMATAGRDSTALIWEMDNLKNKYSKKIKLNSKMTSIVFCSNTKTAIGSEGGTLTIWDYVSNEKIVLNNSNTILSLAFTRTSSGSELLAAGFSNGKVTLYELQDLIPISKRSFTDINVGAEKICFNKTSDLMAVSGADKIIRIYPIDNFNVKPITLKEQNAKIRALIFNNQDKVFAAFANNRIQYWESNCSALANKICSQLTRNMTPAEWQTYVGSETSYRKTCSK